MAKTKEEMQQEYGKLVAHLGDITYQQVLLQEGADNILGQIQRLQVDAKRLAAQEAKNGTQPEETKESVDVNNIA